MGSEAAQTEQSKVCRIFFFLQAVISWYTARNDCISVIKINTENYNSMRKSR